MYIRLGVCLMLAATAVFSGIGNSFAGEENGQAFQKSDENRHLSASEGARYEERNSTIELQDGALLIDRLRDCHIKMPMAELDARKRSVIVVRARKGRDDGFTLLDV